MFSVMSHQSQEQFSAKIHSCFEHSHTALQAFLAVANLLHAGKACLFAGRLEEISALNNVVVLT